MGLSSLCASEGSTAIEADAGSGAGRVPSTGTGGCARCSGWPEELIRARAAASYWEAMHRRACEREEALKREVEALQAKVKQRERELFARRAERGGKSTSERWGSQEPGLRRRRGQQPGAAGHGRRRHEHLPAQLEEYDLGETEKHCEVCGLAFASFEGTEDAELVEVEVGAYRRLIRRRRYLRRCRCPGQPGVITAPAPGKLIRKGSLGVSVWVLVLLDKFLFQRPTYRLLLDLRLSYGLDIAQGTLTAGLKRLVPLIEPLYQGIVVRNLADTRWHADETRWLVFEEVEGKAGHKWYLWAFLSSSTVVFKLDPSRASEVPVAHFGDDATGILNVDRYAAYKVLLESGRILLAFCWAHVRRDFLAIAKDWGGAQEAWGLGWVAQIAVLYGLNRQRLALREQPERFNEAQAQLEVALEQMAKERDAQLLDAELHPARRKVLESLQRHWSGLRLFVAHPEVPMDNNRAERAQRPQVVGRKNYYGSGARRSGELAAMLFSLLQTLLLWNINPRGWLTGYLTACAQNAGNAPHEAEQWLPWNLSETRQLELQQRQARARDGP
jgi:transposase